MRVAATLAEVAETKMMEIMPTFTSCISNTAFSIIASNSSQVSPIRPVPKRHAVKTFLKKRKRPKDLGKSLRDRGGRLCYILGVIGNFLLIFSGSFFV